MKRSLLLLAGVAAAVIALDRWTKQWASSTLPYNQPVPVAGEILRWTFTRNSGVAFGIGQGTGFPYYIFSILAVLVIVAMFLRRRGAPTEGGSGWPRQLALALILGGAIGNLVDRVKAGEVVDFIEVGFHGWHWPVFNVADSAVSVGVVLFALAWSRRPVSPGPAAATAGAPGEPAGLEGAGVAERGAAGPVPGGSTGEPLA
ncbi:MAG: signal peptidase II [Candidatus Eisenbacteria bacterium]|nr:signal peptidase II [Candidatus Eisenbacteria bacterium]